MSTFGDFMISEATQLREHLEDATNKIAALQRELAVLRMDISNRQHFEDTLRADLAAAKRAIGIARDYINNYLLDECDDERLCMDAEHYRRVRELFAALNEQKKDKP